MPPPYFFMLEKSFNLPPLSLHLRNRSLDMFYCKSRRGTRGMVFKKGSKQGGS